MSTPQAVPRRGPAAWAVVLLTLAAVAVVGVVFVAGVAVGVVATRVGAGGSAGAGAAQPLPPAPVLPGDAAAPSAAPSEGATGGAGPGDPAPEAPAGDAAFDQCLVGTWQSTEHSESYDTEQGPASVTGLSRTITFDPDGRQTITYDSSQATVTTEVGALPAVFDGTVVYDASTSGSTMSFELVSAEGTVSVLGPDGEVVEERPLEPGTGDVSYACDETDFVQEAPGFRSAYERAG